MLTLIERNSTRFCDGLNRRGFLRIGGLGFGAAGLNGVTLPQILRAGAAITMLRAGKREEVFDALRVTDEELYDQSQNDCDRMTASVVGHRRP